MPVKHTIKYERVDFDDDNFIEVRGLVLPDISELVEVHTAAAVELYDKFVGRDVNGFSAADAGSLGREILLKFPAICTHVLAIAADAREEFDTIARLPPDVQVAALEKVGHLTFAMQGGLGNFVEIVTRMASGANGLNKKLKSPRS